jgi:hypothetical protein
MKADVNLRRVHAHTRRHVDESLRWYDLLGLTSTRTLQVIDGRGESMVSFCDAVCVV